MDREIEKARIRREILLEEFMRRRVLEAEVRREMMRGIAIAPCGISILNDVGIDPMYGYDQPYFGGMTAFSAAGAGGRAQAELDKDTLNLVTLRSDKNLQDHLEGRRHKVNEARIWSVSKSSDVADSCSRMTGSSSTSATRNDEHIPQDKSAEIEKIKKNEASQIGLSFEEVIESSKGVMPSCMKSTKEMPLLTDDDMLIVARIYWDSGIVRSVE